MTFDERLDIVFNDWLKCPMELTQVEVAAKMGVTHQYISQIEQRAKKKFAETIDKSWIN
jgi:DNA-directed RNA polymerase specialized sigma subunit